MTKNQWLNRIRLFALFSCVFVCIYGQERISVASYYQGRQAAVSYVFDDGLEEHFTMVFPELKKRGLRATFAIIGSKIGGVMHSSQDKKNGSNGTPCMTWEMLRQLTAEGYELSNHGWEHKNVTRLSDEELRYEVQHNDTIIYENTGYFPLTYCYPGNRTTPETVAFCEQNRVGTRTFQVSIGSKRDSVWLRQWIDTLITRGEWGVGMTHGITEGYDHFSDPQVLWHHFEYVSTLQNKLWVAPFCEVAAYIRERDNVHLEIKKKGDSIIITPTSTTDSHLFTQPLTLILQGITIRSAEQNGHALTIYEKEDKQLIDFNPYAGDIHIKKM